MAADERLIVREGSIPATADGTKIGCVMNITSGKNDEIQWFEFKTNYLPPAPIFTIQWELGTMDVVVQAETANWLIKNGYARPMTASEARAYNNGLEGT